MSADVIRILSGTGILGYGFDQASFDGGQADELDLVACDAGSTDGGPFYLGTGAGIVSEAAVRRDLDVLWGWARRNGAPIVIGNCGGSGTNIQLDTTLKIVEAIAAGHGWNARVAVIHSEISLETVLQANQKGLITPLDGAPPLDEATVRSAARIVAMMGTAPVVSALAADADVVLAGRISDAAIFAALPIMRGVEPGVAWHAGKLLECGAACAIPPGPDCIIAEISTDSFSLYAPNPIRTCTPESVMIFALHEAPDMFVHAECGGMLDLSDVEVHDGPGGRVTLRGARFEARHPTVRLEGASRVGCRVALVAATRDPRLIARIDHYLDRTADVCAQKVAAGGIPIDSYRLHARVYGKNGVLGPLESAGVKPSHELCVLVEVIAESLEIARAVASAYRSALLHGDFCGRQCTEGNFALPFSPPELDGGVAYDFSLWHSMQIDDPLDLFPVDYYIVGPK